MARRVGVPGRGGRRLALSAGLALVIGAAVASAAATVGAAPAANGTLVVGVREDVIWDPNAAFNNTTGLLVLPLVYDYGLRPSQNLKRYDPAGLVSVTPAKKFTVWTMKVRPGLEFSNGRPVTAADVKFTIEQRAKSPTLGYTVGSLKRMQVVDKRTVRAFLKAPFAEFRDLSWTGFGSGILPAGFGGEKATEFYRRPYGAGPYVVSSQKVGGELVLTRNPGYWKRGRPRAERIVIKVIPDDNARLLALKSGDIDVMWNLPAALSKQAAKAGSVLRIDPNAKTEFLYLNGSKAPLDDVELRRALWFGVNRSEIVAGAFDGAARLPRGTIPPVLPNAAAGTILPSYSPAKAKQALARSNSPGGVTIELLVIKGDQERNVEAQILQAQLAELGVTLKLVPVDFAEFFDRVTKGKYEAGLFEYGFVVPPPSDLIGFFIATGGFFGGYDTKQAGVIYNGLQNVSAPAAKRRLHARFETYFATNAFAVPLAYPTPLVGYRKGVVGLPAARTPFNSAYLEDVGVVG